MSFIINFIEYGIDHISDLCCVGLIMLYAPYMSIKAIRSRDNADDTQWLSFWVINGLLSFFDRFFGHLIDRFLPFYYTAKLAFVIWLMFFNGAKVVFDTCVSPFMSSYENMIDEQLKRVTDPQLYADLQNLIRDPDARRKLAEGAEQFVKKYGQEAYDTAVKAAASASSAGSKKEDVKSE